MTNNTVLIPRLHALIGDIASNVPEDLAREIECALKEQQFPPAQPMFFTFLDAIRRGEGEDGQPCTTQMLNAQTLASLGRSLSALTAVLDLLHAAERARVDGSTDGQIGDFHRNGPRARSRMPRRQVSAMRSQRWQTSPGKSRATKKPPSLEAFFVLQHGGRYRDRTCDPCRVKAMLYR